MATVNVTVAGTKIDVTSITGGQATFAELVTAVNAVTAGTITGSGTSGDPYVITTPSGYRELEISNGCEILMEADTFIEWGSITTSGQYALDIAAGGKLTIEEGCKLDCSAGAAAAVYWTCYGEIHAVGTEAKPVLIYGLHRWYFYPRVDSELIWIEFDYNRAGYIIYNSGDTNFPEIIVQIKNCKFLNTTSANCRALYLTSNIFVNWQIEDCLFDNMLSTVLYGATVKLKNCTFTNMNDHSILAYNNGGYNGSPYSTSVTPANDPKIGIQALLVLDGCVFQDNSLDSDYAVYGAYGTRVLLKDCVFDNLYEGLYPNTNGMFLVHNNSFTDVANEVNFNNGVLLHAHEIDITVQDENGDPIEGICVSLVQVDGKERHSEFTNSNGKILTAFGGNPFLIEKEETSEGVFEDWSDHYLIASGKGYKTVVRDIGVTQDLTITITMERDYSKIQIDQEVLI